MNLNNASLARSTLYVTASGMSKNWFFNPSENFDEMVSFLNALHCIYECRLHHVMVTNTHVHLMVTPALDNLQEALSFVLTHFSEYAIDQGIDLRPSDIHFQEPVILEGQDHIKNSIRKLYQVPLKAKMVEHSSDYSFSSLPLLMGVS